MEAVGTAVKREELGYSWGTSIINSHGLSSGGMEEAAGTGKMLN